jgi:hypothetical protein
MLWYVEQTVPEPGCTATGTLSCPTVTALMPQVYLPANTSSLSADGNIVASDSLQLNFGDKQTGGSILNTGTIASGGSLTVTTGTLTNQANQVDVGEIWQNVKGGYLETTGTTVQPGGFMSAAAGQMTLNVSQLKQIGGLLQEVNPDGSANNAATQQLLAQVLQQLGGNFTQTAVSDDLHTHFVAAGGFGLGQLAAMVAAVALSAMGMPVIGAMLASTLNQLASGQGFRLGEVLEAGAVALATEGLDNGLGLNDVSLSQVGGDIAKGVATTGEILKGAEEVVGQGLVSATVNTTIYGGSFGRALEGGVINNLAAMGSGAIGATSGPLSLQNVVEHGVLGCVTGAAEGTGCAGGAIGGATSALIAPYLVSEAGGAQNLTAGQRAAIVGISTLLGGVTAGLAGQNAQAGATAAENESLNNATGDHRSEQQKDADQLKDELSRERAKLSGGQETIERDEEGNPITVYQPPPSLFGLAGSTGSNQGASGNIARAGGGSAFEIDLGNSSNDWGDNAANSTPSTLYHYTNAAGMNGILGSQTLNPSLFSLNPNDVRYGNGQYLSDIVPGSMTPAQLSRAFINNPFQGSRYTNYVAIDVGGLNVVMGRPGVFVIPNEVPLDLNGRIVGSGAVKGK